MTFDLILFYRDEEFTRTAVEAGIETVIVDWERVDKRERQRDFDTQITSLSVRDLSTARACTGGQLICRINPYGTWTESEMKTAMEYGADEILLPMVRTAAQVEGALGNLQSGCQLGIMVETKAAVTNVSSFTQYTLARAYIGLNDLHIERRSRHIFSALEDGTVEGVRQMFMATPFGFGGLTLPGMGAPLPCRLLIAELARLECQYSFLRRSFYRDIEGKDLSEEIPRIQAAVQTAGERSSEEIERDQEELIQAIRKLPDPPWRALDGVTFP